MANRRTNRATYPTIVGDVECAPISNAVPVLHEMEFITRPDGTTVTLDVAGRFFGFMGYNPKPTRGPLMDDDFIYRPDGTTVVRNMVVSDNVVTFPKRRAGVTPRVNPNHESAPKTKRLPKGAAEAAMGQMPKPPDFTANTHKPWRKKLGELQALIEARDVEGLRKYHINPISTSPKALDRYRNNALIAIAVQERHQMEEQPIAE